MIIKLNYETLIYSKLNSCDIFEYVDNDYRLKIKIFDLDEDLIECEFFLYDKNNKLIFNSYDTHFYDYEYINFIMCKLKIINQDIKHFHNIEIYN